MKQSRIFLIAIFALSGFALSTTAEDSVSVSAETIADVEGIYAGTFLCALGEMGMTLSIKDAGEFTQKDFAGNPCRSARGTCNEKYVINHTGKRKAKGVLNFFPTISNPEAPKGAFKVSGWVNYHAEYFSEMEFEPGAWIDQPKNFGSSAMTGVLVDGTISGKPTAPGCHILKMHKIQTDSK